MSTNEHNDYSLVFYELHSLLNAAKLNGASFAINRIDCYEYSIDKAAVEFTSPDGKLLKFEIVIHLPLNDAIKNKWTNLASECDHLILVVPEAAVSLIGKECSKLFSNYSVISFQFEKRGKNRIVIIENLQ